jgi:lipid-binding SYLF domain-containing protein
MLSQLRKLATLAMKELSILQTLHRDVVATLARLEDEDPELEEFLVRAHAYAIFPSVGKAAAVVGGGFGKGEVFQRGVLIGYTGIVQATIGLQLGGDTFVELIVFKDQEALARFVQGRWQLAANASAVVVTAGAAASADYEQGVTVFVWSKKGLLLEAALGAQKFIFRPAVLGRGVRSTRSTKSRARR